ncbi:hypothetical protein [Oryzobacter terrae]|uniref:hypothetical protein n=1 Tax=Oryzobacter terrae TaxID=1620385 RepID=UPI003670F6EB
MRPSFLATLTLFAAVAGCSSSTPDSTTDVSRNTITVRATLDLRGNDISVDPTQAPKGTECKGVGGASDIAEGTQVTIRDATSTIIALGKLPKGVYDGPGTYDCMFDIEIPGVPKGHEFYSVAVSDRGELRYTAAEVAAGVSILLDMH